MRAQEIFEVLRSVMDVAMTWWVSSTLLCATILGVTWSKRNELRDSGRVAFHGAFLLVMIFFASICVFGVTLVTASGEIGRRLGEACSAEPAVCKVDDGEALAGFMRVGIGVGTTSFFLFSMAWIGAWVLLSRPVNMKTDSDAASLTIVD